MTGQRELQPTGLTRSQFDCLEQCSEQAVAMQREELQRGTAVHVENAASAAVSNRLINVKLARAIGEVIELVLDQWMSLPDSARYWLAGAMLYFASGNDDEPDFSSPIGFEDDTEVLNACLRYANLNHLCLKVENYDDV